MDLNSLARTLAERLQNDLLAEEIALDDPRELELFEAVIREAIDKTIEEAARIADEHKHYAVMKHCHEEIAAAIRSLKQSNSGRAEQGIVREEWGW